MQTSNNSATSLQLATEKAAAIGKSLEFDQFEQIIRTKFPWRFQIRSNILDRDYLHIVDHHLQHLIPALQVHIDRRIRRVLDFGCGSGGSAIALAMVYPKVYCYGTDVDPDEIAVARERAKLYKVADRCEFHHVREAQPLPFSDRFFDLCQCSSVLEYVVDQNARRFCVQEMVRLISAEGLLFVSAPNRIYPFEVHSWWRGKPNWGWNYFPKLLHATTVDCTAWEVKRLARPTVLKLHQTPIIELFKPWSNFCLRREAS